MPMDKVHQMAQANIKGKSGFVQSKTSIATQKADTAGGSRFVNPRQGKAKGIRSNT